MRLLGERRRRGERIGAGNIALAAACLLALIGSPLAAAAARAEPRCDGKRVTIASNAKRIVATKANDVILAGSRASRIHGIGGNDTICAGASEDRVLGGRGNDTVFGQGGDDTIHGDHGSDHLFGGAGSDRLLGETGNDEIGGGPGDRDHLDGGPGDDSLDGGPGDLDTLFGGVGNDRIEGGPGAHDIASYKGVGGPISVNLASGVVGGAEGERLRGIEDVLGGPGNDTLIGDAGANRLDGGPGDDRLIAAGGGDEAFGGPGSDACSGPFATALSCGPPQAGHGAAVELYRAITGAASLIVTGSEGADRLTVAHSSGTYVVRSAGVDVRLGDPGSGACSRDPAANLVQCAGAAVEFLASLRGGNDVLVVAGSVPAGVPATIDGGEGADALRGGPGNDTIYGGDDRDPETLEGSGGDDVLYGVNVLHPRRDGGAARVIGGPGDDLLLGGQPCGGDLFDGGPGENDSASFARIRNSGINVKATIGGAVTDPDLANCDPGHITDGVEKIEGSPGPDILIGSDEPNTLLGRGGEDVLDGRGGFDRCIEGGGSSRLSNCETDSWRTPLRKRIR